MSWRRSTLRCRQSSCMSMRARETSEAENVEPNACDMILAFSLCGGHSSRLRTLWGVERSAGRCAAACRKALSLSQLSSFSGVTCLVNISSNSQMARTHTPGALRVPLDK